MRITGIAILQLAAQALDLTFCHLLLKVQVNDYALATLHCLRNLQNIYLSLLKT